MRFLTAIAEWMKPRAKAVVAGAATLIVTFYGLQQDGTLSADDWLTMLGAVLTTSGITYAIPNLPAGNQSNKGGSR